MSKEENQSKIRPPPPPTVNKELLGVWNGWCQLGDKEVVREAVAKGNYINWAHTFLASRMRLEPKEVEKWFMEEVYLWVDELLNRKQIFRASHILNNMKLDPIEEFTRLFLQSNQPIYRDYLGEHLLKNGKLNEGLKEAWDLLKILELNDSVCDVKKTNVEEIINAGKEWRSAIGNKLFFKTFDTSLATFLNSQEAWKILINENLDLLLAWINIYYSSNLDFDGLLNSNLEAEYDVRTVFLNLPITETMINSKSSTEKILNELSKYGVFCREEKNDIILLLQRLAKIDKIVEITDIFHSATSNIGYESFMTLLTKFCVKKRLYCLLNWCKIPDGTLKKHEFIAEEVALILYLRQNRLKDIESVGNNIYKVAQFLSKDFQDVFENPLLGIAIMIFSYPKDGLTLLREQNRVLTKSLQMTVDALEKLPILYSLLKSKSNVIKISLYHLKNEHAKDNIRNLYNFRDNGKNVILNFNTKELVAKYGFNKNIDFKFYIKEGRVSMAIKKLIVDNRRDLIEEIIESIAIKHFDDVNIVASCISLCIFLQLNPKKVQLKCWLANRIFQSNILSKNDIISKFRQNQCELLKDVAEKSFGESINFNQFDLQEVFARGLSFVQFSSSTEQSFPEFFLKICAERGLWFLFILFVQFNNYPMKQVQKLCNYFEYNVGEHILRAISYDWQIEEQKNLLMRERDSRKSYLSRVGVRKSMEDFSDSSSSDSMKSSCSSCTDFSISEIEFNETVLQMIIRCHNSSDPPKSLLKACYFYKYPFFAILATSYEPDSVAMNWLIWLAVSCNIEDEFLSKESVPVSTETVNKILQESIKKGCVRVLLESFLIFFPDNSLRFYLEFLCNSLDINHDTIYLQSKLITFYEHLKQMKTNLCPEMDYDFSCLKTPFWLEQTASILTITTIQYQFDSRYKQIEFLKMLHYFNVKQYFTITLPDFNKYYRIAEILLESQTDIELDFALMNQPEKITDEIYRCVSHLQKGGSYDLALEIARMEGFNIDLILINKWRDCRFKNDWKEADKAFEKYRLDPQIAIDFFLNLSNDIEDKHEEVDVLKTCLKWTDVRGVPDLDIERKMWISYIRSQRIDFQYEKPKNLLYRDVINQLEHIHGFNHDLNAEELKNLDKIIGELLKSNNLYQALKLSKLFDYKHTELDTITLCCALAEGVLMPYQLDNDQRLLITKFGNNMRPYNRSRRTLLNSSRLSNLSSYSLSNSTPLSPIQSMNEPIEDLSLDTLAILDTLAGRLKNSTEIAQKMLLMYRISVNIGCKFQQVFLCKDSIGLVKKAINDDCRNKVEIVNDVSYVFHWTKDQMSNFLAEDLITAISEQIKTKQEVISLWDVNLETDFHILLQLLPDYTSNLGLKLYKYASALHKSQAQLFEDFKMSDLSLVIELLIRAHDCFTSDCNMEGISMILRKCQQIISVLLSLKSWKFIVRLLTGVGRYTEMNYVFQILKANDQFEFLLRKGNRKDNGFKVALLEYIKKFCPRDRELYMMVALHFSLFSEIGQMWEDEARCIIRNLITISKLEMQNNGINPDLEPFVLFTNTDGTKICLNKAKLNYTHATEYHLQGEKLNRAMFCAKQAELLALQLAILKTISHNSTTVCLLSLNQSQIFTLMSTELSFPQGLIVSNAYNINPDWGSILFEQCVVRNNTNYLDQFLCTFPIGESIVRDTSRKFLALTAIENTAVLNMKRILSNCPSLLLKYRMASELGFSDMMEDLLKGNELAYLKDTAWKRREK